MMLRFGDSSINRVLGKQRYNLDAMSVLIIADLFIMNDVPLLYMQFNSSYT